MLHDGVEADEREPALRRRDCKRARASLVGVKLRPPASSHALNGIDILREGDNKGTPRPRASDSTWAKDAAACRKVILRDCLLKQRKVRFE